MNRITRRALARSSAGLWIAARRPGAILAAATPVPDVATPPSDSPVARQLAWVLAAINGGGEISIADVDAHFAPSFLQAVPAAQLIATFKQLTTQLAPIQFNRFIGTPKQTEAVADVTAKDVTEGIVTIQVESGGANLITGLLIQPASAQATPVTLTSWDDFDAGWTAFAPQSQFLATEIKGADFVPIHQLNADEQLAIGSTFKLYVLGELARQVATGLVGWTDELAIREEWKSLPSGTMQDEPAGTKFTLRKFAEQMISISDNTAADHLIHHLGRENVEAMFTTMGQTNSSRNIPLATTRELFAMKLVATDEQRQQYFLGDVASRRALLAAMDGVDISTSTVSAWTQPIDIDVLEYFATSSELARAMAYLKAVGSEPATAPVLDILAINPGVQFQAHVWNYVGYKGGSEPGALSLTWLLERGDNRWFVLTGTLNDENKAFDETAPINLLGSALQLLGSAR